MMTFDVAMIEPVGGHGGMDYYDFGLCLGLAQSGVGVILYTCDETNDPHSSCFTIKKWYRGIYGEGAIVKRGWRFSLATLRVFSDLLFKRIPTVHFHFFVVGFSQLGLITLAKMLGRKVVITVHDVEGIVENRGSSRLAKIAYSWADKLIVHNEFSKVELNSSLKTPASKIAVIPHGNYRYAYPNLVDRISARAQLGWSQEERVLLFFGQIKGVKRLDLLLTAFSEVIKTQPNTRLVIAGKVIDVPFSEYQAQIDKLNIAKKCTCLIRYIDNDEVPLFFAATDLVVLPYDRIYQSGVVLMAMSFLRAVVVSDIPGMLEVVKDNETGYVFRNGDSSALTSCLLRALENEANRERIAYSGYELMDKEYSWSVVGNMTADMYREIVHI